MQTLIENFSERIREAAARRTPLRLRGGGTKDFYGCSLEGELLETGPYRGVVDYEPSELVITARCGTPLAEVERTLDQGGQMLAFEPPHFGERATLGGCIAAGFSGPRRAYAGSARDYILGARLLDGRGQDLRFGGQVMKNVAGFDLSRLVTGSCGSLGLLLDLSLKVLPKPEKELTLSFECTDAQAIERMNQWAGRPLPLSASCYLQGRLHLRLSGAHSAVDAGVVKLGGEQVPDAGDFWRDLREQRLPGFGGTLWRLSVKSSAPPLGLPGSSVIEWGGALRWIATDAPAEQIHAAARNASGTAARFRGGARTEPPFLLTAAILELQRGLKATLDPDSILNPGRLHPQI